MEEMDLYQADGQIMDFDFEESRHLQEHSHQNIEVIYILEGALSLTVGRNRFEMKKGDIIAVESMKKHSYLASESVLVGIVQINCQALSEYLETGEYYFRCNSVIDKNKGYQEMQRILDKILRLYFDKKQEKVYLNSLYFSLLHTMITNFACRYEELSLPGAENGEEQRLNEIVKYVKLYYRYPISLGDLADQLYLTTAYLSKYIKKKLGMNFIDYVNQVRLKSAVEDMKNSRKSLTRIALDNGFPNTMAFSNAFKKEHGATPSVWQKEYHEEQARKNEEQKARLREKEEHIQEFLEQQPGPKPDQDTSDKILTEADARKTDLLKRNWNRMINIGSVTMLLQLGLRRHLQVLHEELGFEYVRFWDIFSPQMHIDLKKSNGKLNFKRLDAVIDFLIENGMHPFVELGFKPVNLLKTTEHTMVLEERENIFETTQEYAQTLHNWVAHCVNRYGMEEVEQWYFEQWGDPRITNGDGYGKYFEVFEAAYDVLKQISPHIRIGGAGFGRLYSKLELQEVIELWKKRMCYPDFISMYAYPYMARSSVSQNSDRIQDPNFVNNQVMMMREVLQKSSFYVRELMLTEWSSSVSDWNSLNDSMYKGAFMLKSIIDNIGCLDMMGYWLASDILTESFDTGELLHGGNGLLSVDEIRKPAFYAMQFAGRMGSYLLARDEHSIVTSNGRGNYYIACHHYVKPNFKYYLKKEDEVEVQKQFLLFDETEPLKLCFRLNNVRNGVYIVNIRSLSDEHGSVQDEWAKMGYSENLSRQDIEYLRNTSMPEVRIRECAVENHILEIETVLRPQEIQALHLKYRME